MYTDCDNCGSIGHDEEKTIIHYNDDDVTLSLCPECTKAWEQEDDGGVILRKDLGKG